MYNNIASSKSVSDCFNAFMERLFERFSVSPKVGIEKISKILYGYNQNLSLPNQYALNEFYPLPDGVVLANGITDSIRKLLNIAGNLGIGIIQTF